MTNLKYFDNISKAILKAQEKLGKDATLSYLEGYISSLKRIKDLHEKFDNARQYVDFNIKEGVFNESDWENLSMNDFIKKAEYEMERADFYANDYVQD